MCLFLPPTPFIEEYPTDPCSRTFSVLLIPHYGRYFPSRPRVSCFYNSSCLSSPPISSPPLSLPHVILLHLVQSRGSFFFILVFLPPQRHEGDAPFALAGDFMYVSQVFISDLHVLTSVIRHRHPSLYYNSSTELYAR